MPRNNQNNPYAGNYSPARISLTKQDIEAGLKGIKVKSPNRKMSTQAYKSGLPKSHEGGGSNG